MKRYEYPAGNVETIIRLNRGKSFHALIHEINAMWTPGNEHLWDNYDIESLIDTNEKRHHTVNLLLDSRLSVYRAMRASGRDCNGRDPFQFVADVPEVMRRLRRLFPDVLEGAGEGSSS